MSGERENVKNESDEPIAAERFVIRISTFVI